MFREMRRSDREITENETESILAGGEYGVLSTVGSDGYPYGTPVNYVYRDKKIYFHCAKDVGHKIDNLRHCAKVCFTVVGNAEVTPETFSTKYESVIAFGTAREVTDGKQPPLESIVSKYASELKEAGLKYIRGAIDSTAVYEITIEHMTGKARKE